MKFLFSKYLKQYTGKLVLCFICMLLFALISGFSLSMLSPLLNAIFHTGSINQTPTFLSRLNNFFLKKSPFDCILLLSVAIVVVFLIKGILGYVYKYLAAGVEERVMQNIRNDLYSHLHFLSLDYFHQTESGTVISRITNDVAQIKESIKDGFLSFIGEALVVFAYFLFALYLSWRLLLITSITFPLMILLVNHLAQKLRRRSEKLQEDMGEITSALSESLPSIKIIKAFGMEKFEMRKFFKATYNYCKSALKFERIGILGVPATELLTAVGICIILLFGGHQIFVSKSLSPENFLIFLACIISMFQPLKMITKANVVIQRGLKAVERVKRVLDEKPSVVEAKDSLPIKSFEKEIVFRNVVFGYNEGPRVIDNISLTIRKGESVALVGPSGGGKTTLTDLLLRFYDPCSGVIEIDGVDIKRLKIQDYRKLIGLVTQEPVLFNDTIFNNIAYGVEDARMEDVENVAKMANADEFIEKLPKRYNTIIGERGVKLSSGERQRIAIARALFKNSEILIFDEATSHLDSETEEKVQSAIERLLKGRTAIVIAHRLSTVKGRDRIVVIDNGRIVEEGTHEELIKLNGLYTRLISYELS